MRCGRVLWLSVIILLLLGVNRFFRFKSSSRGTDYNLNGSLGFKFDSLSLSITQKLSSFLRLSVSFEEDNFELICIQELFALVKQDTGYFNYLKTDFVNLQRLESYITVTL